MSRVYVAEDKALRRRIVIKVLAPDRVRGISADRFDREIMVLARLQNPHIVPLFATGAVDDIPYYTMPYIEGESLRKRLERDQTLNAKDAIRVLRDVTVALEYAHEHGVIHRDIKPDNILLSGGSACVADFGIARAITVASTDNIRHQDSDHATLTGAGMTVGTPAYMSPEQATSSPDIDHRTDLYSLGCVAFEVLTGKAPFAGRSQQATLAAHVVEKPPLARLRHPSIPPVLAHLVEACLQKSPDDRPRDAAEVLSMLDAVHSTRVSAGARKELGASIAVLPFENMSGERDNEFFSDGVSEEIINSLAQIPGLRVAGRTSSFAFKGMKIDLATVGEKLNVDTVLEGSVRKAGNRVRITAQLIKARDGYHLWSERFDREATDIFAIQDEIAAAIAGKLKLSLDNKADFAQPLTSSVEAYELFTKGRSIYYLPGWRVTEAVSYFERAVELDDNFALAHASLADALSLSAYYGLVRPADVADRSRAASHRAISLAPDNSDARHSIALWRTFFGGDRQQATAAWREVVKGSALRTQVRCSYAVFGLGLFGANWERAIQEVHATIDLDPLNGFAHAMLVMMLTFAGKLNDVVAFARRSIELDPASFWSQLALQRALHCTGMHSEAQKYGIKTLELTGRHPFVMAELAVDYASVGERAAAKAIFAEMLARSSVQYIQPSPLALCATAAGELDDAIALCHRAFDARDPHILWALTEAWDGWQPLYKHPGWKDVRKRVFTTWRSPRSNA
jgi:serine/threonine-protein kinase